jgi:hypothetical protein
VPTTYPTMILFGVCSSSFFVVGLELKQVGWINVGRGQAKTRFRFTMLYGGAPVARTRVRLDTGGLLLVVWQGYQYHRHHSRRQTRREKYQLFYFFFPKKPNGLKLPGSYPSINFKKSFSFLIGSKSGSPRTVLKLSNPFSKAFFKFRIDYNLGG